MKIIYLILCILIPTSVWAEDLTTVKGKTYSNVQVIRIEQNGVNIKHSGGIAKLFWNELPSEVQNKYGFKKKAEPILNSFETLRPFEQKSRLIFENSPKPKEKSGEWHISSEINKIDDSLVILASLQAKNTINHSLGECHPRLIIRWKENELSLFISYNFFINTEDINVTTRMGSLPAVVNLWSVSSDYEAIFYKGTNFQCADFIKQMSNHKSFVIRFTPYGQSPFISEFNTEGIDEVIYEIGSYLNN